MFVPLSVRRGAKKLSCPKSARNPYFLGRVLPVFSALLLQMKPFFEEDLFPRNAAK
jgi:hypothetical protein